MLDNQDVFVTIYKKWDDDDACVDCPFTQSVIKNISFEDVLCDEHDEKEL